jgi:UDP-2,3-diacylglucosamine pyrophosphatase LpxH
MSKAKKKKPTKRALAQQIEAKKKYDPLATAEDCLKDIATIRQKYPFEDVSRDFYRIHGKYSDATWSRHFGTFAQFKRKGGIGKSQIVQSIERGIALHDSLDVFRKYYDTEVKPFHGKYERVRSKTGMKTILVGSDFHDIDTDPFMLAVFLDTAKRLQPDHIILNGDIFDLYEFSRFEVDPRCFDIAGRFNFVKQNIFGTLRKACPDADIDLIIGNHEFRLMRYLSDKSPAMKVLLHDVMGLRLKDIFGLDEYKINLVAKIDLSAYKVGEVKDEVKENFKIYYDCYVASHEKDWKFGVSGTNGHTHKPRIEVNTSVPMGKMTWMNTGCMAKTPVVYQEGKDTYIQGFGIAHIDPVKKQVTQENIIVTGDFAVVAGKYYFRK